MRINTCPIIIKLTIISFKYYGDSFFFFFEHGGYFCNIDLPDDRELVKL